ncbi:hypothetical protein CDAR_376231 [Caerostris darwini]|uniref:Uncharacterized protein n=1 Tax=Caerostris darwini TaxID=1538125 RepID=A0AAV4QQ27_9ARAC|nr:hypothetical protein CDAR_376231 [Caerostris darwini]
MRPPPPAQHAQPFCHDNFGIPKWQQQLQVACPKSRLEEEGTARFPGCEGICRGGRNFGRKQKRDDVTCLFLFSNKNTKDVFFGFFQASREQTSLIPVVKSERKKALHENKQ